MLGGELLRLLLAEGHEARCLIRSASPNASRLVGERAEILRGDAAREEDLYRALRDTDAMLHVAGIEYAPPSCARPAGQESNGS